MAAGKTSVGYVLSLAVDDDVFMGGVMVTDAAGLPLEFRYTEPVRATRLQRVLYGDVLERYIHSDVVTANLVGRLEQKPDLFLVADPHLLPSLHGAGKKTAFLLPAQAAPLKEYGAQQEAGDGEFLLQLSDSGSPARVRIPSGMDAARRAEIARVLVEIGRSMDPWEPLARVEAAVRMLWEESQAAPAA